MNKTRETFYRKGKTIKVVAAFPYRDAFGVVRYTDSKKVQAAFAARFGAVEVKKDV